MSKINVGIPQGTRDFSAETVRKRNHIIQCIQKTFELYGFQPLETPAMENLETLMGKYGDEGDKLIFKILNNGLGDPKNLEKARKAFENVLQGKNDSGLTERALRYDLTIPFARYVAMNHGQLSFPFKRYQVQPVWRADRPQKGRYREFWQCDADVVGSRSLLNEVELASIYLSVFDTLGIEAEIKINSRKILAGLAETCGAQDRLTDITTAIDKLDKTSMEKVIEELKGGNLEDKQIDFIERYLSIQGNNVEKLAALKNLLAGNVSALKGIEELEYIFQFFPKNSPALTVDLCLARGLNYYTGAIFEVKAVNTQMGSIGGGGRYDNLTGLFGVPDVPGVGISFGLDRIYDVMEQLKLFPSGVGSGTRVLFFNLGETEASKAFELLQQLRARDIPGELFHEDAKFDKQFKYAEKKKIPFVIIIGSKELAEGTCVVRHLGSGVQETIPQEAIAAYHF
jgi:histidyl-tRNA synthetase